MRCAQIAVTDDPDTPATETVLTEPSGTPTRAYPDSKILAERDAWDLAAETGLELSAVLPTFMQGPMLGAPRAGTTEVVRRLLAGQVPAVWPRTRSAGSCRHCQHRGRETGPQAITPASGAPSGEIPPTSPRYRRSASYGRQQAG